MTVAALFVDTDGPYANLDGVEVWDEARDARKYAGPHPVVAHPPCNKWSKIAFVNQAKGILKVGDDGGRFEASLAAVQKWGGGLEHPASSHAWDRFGLLKPPTSGARIKGLYDEGWVCQVDQAQYGCKCNKPTWLYVVGCDIKSLKWGKKPQVTHRIGNLKGVSKGVLPRMSPRLASATPEPFRDILLSMARSVRPNVRVG